MNHINIPTVHRHINKLLPLFGSKLRVMISYPMVVKNRKLFLQSALLLEED